MNNRKRDSIHDDSVDVNENNNAIVLDVWMDPSSGSHFGGGGIDDG